MNGKSAIWVTWEHQTRNKSLSGLLGIPLHEIVSEKKGVKRYAESLLKTFQLIRSCKPDVVFCQNPSIVLGFFCVLVKKLLSFSLIVDEHNAGIFPLDGRNRVLNWVAQYIIRNADAVIVTNTSLANQCRSWCGNPIVVEDPLPDFAGQYSANLPVFSGLAREDRRPFELLFICTWAPDEPYLNVLQAAEAFSSETLKITVTGNYNGKLNVSELPDCVHLTGFLSKQDYVSQLANTDGVLVLTTREDCLNCGAYEAVSLLKPGILSDTSALRQYFSSGFLFTDNSVGDLIHRITLLSKDKEFLRSQVECLRSKCEANDLANRQKVFNFLAKLA
jgi:glycosyltransferase involved in cell wall biosynthesis|tara:strand:+ start:935 stop:1933 length:999 start_codon:yes stop_codon:yes gene_type:complete